LSYSNGFSKQVPVSFEISRVVYDTIITDEEWLWQMLLNLLTNACKYTDRGSIHVRVSVAAALESMSSDRPNPPAMAEKIGIKRNQAVRAAELIPAESGEYLLFEVCDTGTKPILTAAHLCRVVILLTSVLPRAS
jgi:signal transduction histidine kinase